MGSDAVSAGPRRSTRAGHRPEFAVFALVLGATAYFYQAGGWNQNSRFDLTRALVERRTAAIDAYAENTGDSARRGTHLYCDKAPGISWLAAPAWAAVWLGAGAPAEPSPRLIAAGSYVGTVLAAALPTAAAAGLLFGLARTLALPAGWSAGAALAWALATLAFPYATLLYGHQTVASFHLSALAILARSHRGPGPTRAQLAAVGGLLGASVALDYGAALGGAMIGAYALRVVGWRRPLGWMVLAAAVPVAALLAYHWRVFGGPFVLPYAFSTLPHRHQGWFMGLGAPDTDILRRILVSEYRGLLYTTPWLALALPGVALLIAERATRAEGVLCAAGILSHLWLNSSLVDWHGGWAFGPRYLVPSLPYWVVGALGVARRVTQWRSPAARRAVAAGGGGIVLASFLVMLVGTAVKPEVPLAIEQPVAWVWLQFRSGALAVNTQSFSMPVPIADGPPHAWNLGQLIGLTGGASLIPLAVWLALGTAWLASACRRANGEQTASRAIFRENLL